MVEFLTYNIWMTKHLFKNHLFLKDQSSNSRFPNSTLVDGTMSKDYEKCTDLRFIYFYLQIYFF